MSIERIKQETRAEIAAIEERQRNLENLSGIDEILQQLYLDQVRSGNRYAQLSHMLEQAWHDDQLAHVPQKRSAIINNWAETFLEFGLPILQTVTIGASLSPKSTVSLLGKSYSWEVLGKAAKMPVPFGEAALKCLRQRDKANEAEEDRYLKQGERNEGTEQSEKSRARNSAQEAKRSLAEAYRNRHQMIATLTR